MKLDEILNHLRPKEEISVQQRKEIKYIFDSMLKPHEGHPVFEVDILKKEVRIADVKPIDTVGLLTWKEELKKQDILKKPNCIYLSSLNIDNLLKRLGKIGITNLKYIKEDKQLFVNKHRKVVINTI